MERMNYIEKREFIYSHLHKVDENLIDEMFIKISKTIGDEDIIVGYEASGVAITKSNLAKELQEADDEIDRGDCIALENLKKESEKW